MYVMGKAELFRRVIDPTLFCLCALALVALCASRGDRSATEPDDVLDDGVVKWSFSASGHLRFDGRTLAEGASGCSEHRSIETLLSRTGRLSVIRWTTGLSLRCGVIRLLLAGIPACAKSDGQHSSHAFRTYTED